MAIAGAWLGAKQGVDYSTELKQGDGVSPIHSTRNGGRGRNTAPGYADPATSEISPDLLSEEMNDGTGYTDDPAYVNQWQYPAEELREIGLDTDINPEWGSDTRDTRASVQPGWPNWGENGDYIRSQIRGAIATSTPNAQFSESAAAGWRNKESDLVEFEGFMPDLDQIYVQTSMIQRNKERTGSQRGAGSDSEYSAPIKSRTVGPKLKFFSGASENSNRHYDMAPKAQDQIIRPFWMRTMGTGFREDMAPNEMYRSAPVQRTPPEDPYLGPDTGDMTPQNYGFVAEDSTW